MIEKLTERENLGQEKVLEDRLYHHAEQHQCCVAYSGPSGVITIQVPQERLHEQWT